MSRALEILYRWIHKLYGAVHLIRACRDWRPWFREYFTSPDDGRLTRYRMRNGAVLMTRRNRMDFRILDEIWAFRKYDYYGYRIRPGSTVLDVGAHIGLFSVYAATECDATRVIACEPHPGNYDMLERNVRTNGLTNVTCANIAVGGVTGTGRLRVAPSNSGGHRMAAGSEGGHLSVGTSRLVDILDTHGIQQVDYLKMDCEGSEYEILESATPETMARIQRISMEYHEAPGHHVEDIAMTLKKRGFSVIFAERDRLYATRETDNGSR